MGRGGSMGRGARKKSPLSPALSREGRGSENPVRRVLPTAATGPSIYSASIPAALITLPHFWVSAAWNLASSSGVVVQASEPAFSKKLLAAALLVAAVSSSLRRATTGAGVLAGT